MTALAGDFSRVASPPSSSSSSSVGTVADAVLLSTSGLPSRFEVLYPSDGTPPFVLLVVTTSTGDLQIPLREKLVDTLAGGDKSLLEDINGQVMVKTATAPIVPLGALSEIAAVLSSYDVIIKTATGKQASMVIHLSGRTPTASLSAFLSALARILAISRTQQVTTAN